jgi:hypothetical protein
MKSTLMTEAIVFGAALSGACHAEPAKIVLECGGYSRVLNDPMEHYIVITGATATVDDKPTRVLVTPDTYVFYALGKDDRPLLSINRIKGNYWFWPQGNATENPDWSRPKDYGCHKATQKF